MKWKDAKKRNCTVNFLENSGLLGCNKMSIGKQLPTFKGALDPEDKDIMLL